VYRAALAQAQLVVHPRACGRPDRLLAETLAEPRGHVVPRDAELAGVHVEALLVAVVGSPLPATDY
jgi:hypothetical protein